MMIHIKPLYRFLAALGLIATLTACGSGGGDNKDSTPDSFTFTPVTDAAVSTEVTSSAVTLAGFNQDVSISITGGSYSTGGAYTTTAGTVSSGKSVTVKLTTSVSTNTPVEAVLTVGGVTGTFKVTTKADITPDTFSFTAATGVTPKSVTTSTAITVAGIDIAVPISITGGEYSINDGAYTSAAGTVSKNQTVKVRGTASASTTTTTNVALTISDKSANYSITTFADTVAPTAQILFPPPVSMTEGNTILVRGSASDDYSTVTSVKVNGVTATTADGFKNWQALVPLADTTKFVTASTPNTLTVVTKDSAGNESTNAAHVDIRQAPLTSAFPDNINGIKPLGLALDQLDGRNRLLVASARKWIYGIDLMTGVRTLVTTLTLPDDCNPKALLVSSISKRAYAPCVNSDNIVDIDLSNPTQLQPHVIPNFIDADATDGNSNAFSALLDTKDGSEKMIINYQKSKPWRMELFAINTSFTQFTIMSNAEKSIPDSVNPIQRSYGIALDKSRKRYLVTDFLQQTIFAVDATTGARSIFSANTKGGGDAFADIGNGILSGIVVDESNDRALVAEYYDSAKIFSVDLASGNRSLLTSTSETNPFNSMYQGFDIKILDSHGYAFIADGGSAVFAVDLVTGHRVVFSKSVPQ